MNNEADELVVDFQGEIDENNIRSLKNTIITKANEERKANILVSLKSIYYKNNLKAITLLITEVEKISIKMGVSVDFIDYSEALFIVLKNITHDTGINLYKNRTIAILFIKSGSFKTETKVLVYDENDEISKSLYFALCKYGYEIERALDMKKFLSGVNDESYDIVVSRSILNKRVRKENKATLTLSKKLIMNLPIFMNKSAETLLSFTGLEAKKIAHSIKCFDSSLDNNSISAVMTFSGDLEGYFTLIFPRNIAVIALEALLGEKVASNDVATLKDGIGEFCNIITGAAKTEFDEKNIKVIFELPKTYTSLKDTQNYIGNNNGVWMDMQLSEKPFYMFITK